MSFKKDRDISHPPKSCSFPFCVTARREKNLQPVALAKQVVDYRGPTERQNVWTGPYLWGWWSDSPGHSPVAADKKPLPAAVPAPAPRGSGWGLASGARCGQTCCSRWSHPATKGKHEALQSSLICHRLPSLLDNDKGKQISCLCSTAGSLVPKPNSVLA